ncbi:restriction endonuclease subunit S domain-containing protein [Oceanimonas smirnovii]|uniref:Type I restriction modification DNA specificity domain-containing protein n=1 Tax=Oceanimonas smirnovii TaxID=264574 RepID=A0ABW7NXH7_9GAMM
MIMHDFSAIQNVLPFKGLLLNIYWIFFATVGKQEFVEYKGHWPDFVIKEIVEPNNDLPERFGQLVSNLMVTQFRNEQQNKSLSAIRDTLLPKLLSGELTIPDAEEQLAEVVEN